MIDKTITKELAEKISFSDLQAYLRNKGWIQIEKNSSLIAVYRRNEDPNAEVLVPLKSTFSDYYSRLIDALNTLADFEGRTTLDIINDITATYADIIRFRYENDLSADGTIPLIDGIAFLDNTMRAFSAAALSAKTAQSFHSRMYSAEMTQLLNSCILGIEKGSFVASITVPISISPQTTLTEGTDGGFSRKTTENLMLSLAHLSKYITLGDYEKIYTPNSEEPVVSANLCKALISLFPSSTKVNISITSSWAKCRPPSEQLPISVIFTSECIPHLITIEKNLRPRKPSEQDVFVGRVDSLNGEPDKENRMIGEVDLLIQQSGEENLFRAKVYLKHEDYTRACDAHKYNKFISLEGEIEWKPRFSKIIKYNNFKIINMET